MHLIFIRVEISELITELKYFELRGFAVTNGKCL